MARILVIDDDADFLEMIRLILENRGGHSVEVSADGAEGLNKALSDPPHMAIIDVMMPDVTGYEVCRELRAHPATAQIPLLILTARGQEVDREAALESGADEHIAKPVAMEDLLEVVNDLLTISYESSAAPNSQIALFSLRGGVGVTTVAVNLAIALSKLDIGSICLADLCPSSGHTALQLGLRPQPSWGDLLHTDTLDEDVLGEHLLHHASGLHVLASPMVPHLGDGLGFNVTQSLLALLRTRFSTVVVDTPAWLGEATIAVLRAATFAGLVVTPEPASIQAALGTLQALKAQDIETHLIINQNRPEPQIPLGAMERILKQKPRIALPFDPAHPATLTQGRPLILQQPDAPFTRAIAKFAQGIHQME